MKAPKYRPLDEILTKPTVKVLRALSRFDWASSREVFLAAGAPDDHREGDYNSLAVTLSRLVKRGHANCRGSRNDRQYQITDAGRQLLAQRVSQSEQIDEQKPRRAKSTRKVVWTREQLDAKREEYHRRKANRLCVACAAGLQEGDGVRCVECRAISDATTRKWAARKVKSASLETRRAWRRANRDLVTRRQREYYWENKQAGLCVYCSAPAEDTVCCVDCGVRHKARNRKYAVARRAKRRELGVCTVCQATPVPGRTKCQLHLTKQLEANRRWKERLKNKTIARAA